jgi:hypothetical protein
MAHLGIYFKPMYSCLSTSSISSLSGASESSASNLPIRWYYLKLQQSLKHPGLVCNNVWTVNSWSSIILRGNFYFGLSTLLVSLGFWKFKCIHGGKVIFWYQFQRKLGIFSSIPMNRGFGASILLIKFYSFSDSIISENCC